ncbi:hypothetical protein BH24DEI2_BH24DEI2_10520 [soil metagenome]
MKYQSPAAFRQALDAQLNNWARERQTNVNRLRTQLAFERLLARLFATGEERWVLKGGYALELRLGERARATRDLDLNVPPPAFDDVLSELRDAAERDQGDFFRFTLREDKRPLAGPPLGGHRFFVEAWLDERVFARFPLDVGQGDETVRQPDWVNGQVDLSFAGLLPPRLAIYPLEDHFAEKLHAYTTPRENPSRVKDLVDMLLLVELGLEASVVKRAVANTFERYERHELPDVLPCPPATWRQPFAVLAEEVGLASSELEGAYKNLLEFLQVAKLSIMDSP